MNILFWGLSFSLGNFFSSEKWGGRGCAWEDITATIDLGKQRVCTKKFFFQKITPARTRRARPAASRRRRGAGRRRRRRRGRRRRRRSSRSRSPAPLECPGDWNWVAVCPKKEKKNMHYKLSKKSKKIETIFLNSCK